MTDATSPSRLGFAGWLAIAVMAIFLGISIWYASYTWNQMGGVGISPMGWLFLVLGVVVTFIVGAGLMALLFYSSRTGRDI